MKYQALCKTCTWRGRLFQTRQAAECDAASHELVARHYTQAYVRRALESNVVTFIAKSEAA